jgi:membrane-bound lytic murein transglycosylase D
MKRWLALAVGGGFALGCSGAPRPKTEPAPVVVPPPAPPPAEVLPPAPDLGIVPALADTAALRRLANDSLQDRKDMELLEQLHDSTPPAGTAPLGTEAEVDLAEMFDINVARYADHQRVRYYLDFFRGRARDRMTVWLERLPVYEPMIRSALSANGLPSDLVYLGLVESGYSNTAISRSRAVGMWQFMKGTAKLYGLRVDGWVDERRDPIKATAAAARYLADLTKRFDGSHYLAAAAYNSGGGTVSRGLRKLGPGADQDYVDPEDEDRDLPDDPIGDDRYFHLSKSRYIRKETKDYVPKLIAAAMIAKQPERYGFAPLGKVDPFAVDSVAVTEPTSLDVVAKAGGVDPGTLETLNPQLLRGITPPTGRPFWIRVPAGTGAHVSEAVAQLAPGERIPGTTHVVRKGETLRAIARRYGLTPSELAAFNPGVDPVHGTKPGTELRVPGTARLRSFAAEDSRMPAAHQPGSTVHRVRRGETVASIARKYRMTPSQLRAMNELGDKDGLRVGQRLRVGGVRRHAESPEPRPEHKTRVAKPKSVAASSYLVKPGDTLTAVARRYGVSVKALMAANGLSSQQGLKAGARLKIPS